MNNGAKKLTFLFLHWTRRAGHRFHGFFSRDKSKCIRPIASRLYRRATVDCATSRISHTVAIAAMFERRGRQTGEFKMCNRGETEANLKHACYYFCYYTVRQR